MSTIFTLVSPPSMEAPLIGCETRMLLRHYLDSGMSKRAIARKLRISRDTLYRWIQDGDLDRDLDEQPVRYGPRPALATKLDRFRPVIEARLSAFPELSSVRLLEEIRADGYTGGYTQLTEFVRRVRPHPVPEPVVRFETPPAHQAQVDFAEFRFPWGKRFALLVVLGYSRLLWLRFYPRQDMRTLYSGLEEALTFFGGVPKEMLFDQMKAVITKDLRLLGGQLVHNEEFLRFAGHWGFTSRACRAYRAQTKGKVERPISYIRDNFVYGRTFLGDGDLDDQCTRWLDRANRRIHGTTRERPILRFEEERHLLRPLAERPYQSLVLAAVAPEEPPKRLVVPLITVERRPLAAYSALVAGAA
jgi:transposase